jgi:hypothetical protein
MILPPTCFEDSRTYVLSNVPKSVLFAQRESVNGSELKSTQHTVASHTARFKTVYMTWT